MTIPEGFSQVSVVHTGGGIVDEAIWTVGVNNAFDVTPATIAGEVVTLLGTLNYEDLISSSVEVPEVRVKNGPDVNGPSAVDDTGIVGSIGGQAAPPNVSLLVHKLTAVGGRQGRGRLYMPGIAEASLEAGGGVEAALLADAQTFFSAFRTGMAFLNRPLALLHADASEPNEVTTLTVDARFATQRRRMRR